ncbi:U1 small nuclear ribonucleoprotein C [Sesamum angolense]|uniref:U1 small nuclear ribonucleoprotein C n=1 Tax=Sesamum angolense TaxID=2727404 RepID=A0AAE2BKA7_9LAMI|nr:U1 small nuclear ribonucleoprotein C [Sesamum angolense]
MGFGLMVMPLMGLEPFTFMEFYDLDLHDLEGVGVKLYYCDYCDTYLTHDSPSVRKQHNAGYKHKANIRAYYQKFEEQQTQILIDQKIKEHLGQAAAYQQIGAAYNHHLAAYPGGRPRLPVIPPPMLPIPGAIPPQLAPGVRPPVLPVPVPGVPGYGAAPVGPMQPPPGTSLPLPPGGAPAPPSTSAPPPVPGGGPPPSSSGVLPPATQMYNANPIGTAAATATPGGYSYPQASQTIFKVKKLSLIAKTSNGLGLQSSETTETDEFAGMVRVFRTFKLCGALLFHSLGRSISSLPDRD